MIDVLLRQTESINDNDHANLKFNLKVEKSVASGIDF